jgi:hypothetical protein
MNSKQIHLGKVEANQGSSSFSICGISTKGRGKFNKIQNPNEFQANSEHAAKNLPVLGVYLFQMKEPAAKRQHLVHVSDNNTQLVRLA